MYLYNSLNILVNLVINSYFNHFHCLLLIGNENFNYQGKIPIVINSQIEENVFKYHGCEGIIIFGDDSKKMFESLENLMKISLERFNFRRYLVLTNNNLDIFTSKSLDYVSDFLVICRNSLNDEDFNKFGFENDGIFKLYTHKYIGGEKETKEVVKIDEWFTTNESFLFGNDLYPDKLNNQMGRELKIATFNYQPYSIPGNKDGTEILVALEFARKYNMTPKFIIDDVGMWGEIFDNWTGNGILGNLVMDKGDVGMGALYTWEHDYHFLDFTKPTIRTGITCIAPSPKIIGGWITPLLSFSWKLWIMMFISFLLAFLAIFLAIRFDESRKSSKKLDKKESLLKSFMLTEAIFLLQGLSKIPTNSKARVIFALTLLLSLMSATLYNSGLASNMTVPRYKGTIDNVYDLINSDVKWGANSYAWISSLTDDNNYVYKKVVSKFYKGSNEDLMKKNNDSFAFSIERLHGGHYAIGEYITKEGVQERRLMSQDIYWDYCLFMLRKSSILLPKFDKLILEVSQTGLPNFWEYQVTVRNSDMKMQEAVRRSSHSKRSGIIKLNFTHVEGAFALWFLGISISTVVFLWELWSSRNKKFNN